MAFWSAPLGHSLETGAILPALSPPLTQPVLKRHWPVTSAVLTPSPWDPAPPNSQVASGGSMARQPAASRSLPKPQCLLDRFLGSAGLRGMAVGLTAICDFCRSPRAQRWQESTLGW